MLFVSEGIWFILLWLWGLKGAEGLTAKGSPAKGAKLAKFRHGSGGGQQYLTNGQRG